MGVTPNRTHHERPVQALKPTSMVNGSLQKWTVIESALGSWRKTFQLCLILFTLGVSTAVAYGLGFLLWLMVR